MNQLIEDTEREIAQLQEKLQLLHERAAQKTTSETQEQQTPTPQISQSDRPKSVITECRRARKVSKQTDPLVRVREDQKRRIIATGKSLHSINKEIEFFLTDRENPFNFISKPFGEHKPSVTNYWSTEVWSILKKVMPDEGWTFSDAERRLQIICVDKRRNYQLGIRKAGRNQQDGKTARIAAGTQSAPMG